MKYPKFLQKNDLIGITALSCGCGSDIKETKISFNHLKNDYRLLVTEDVYGPLLVSAGSSQRALEFNDLLKEKPKLIFVYRGGNYLYEVLDDIHYEEIVNQKIWISGYSDPTSLLYILTTKYDLATIYGFNGKSYDQEKLSQYHKNNLEILKGNLVKQESFMDRVTVSLNGNFKSKGVIIGGCLDVLRYLFGTAYDKTHDFLSKYQKEGIIWYFDIYSMSSIDVYITLLQMKKMGYFEYSDTFLFGTEAYTLVDGDLSYDAAYQKALGKKNIVLNANIGHIKPCFTIINGSLAKVVYQGKKLTLEMELMHEDNG